MMRWISIKWYYIGPAPSILRLALTHNCAPFPDNNDPFVVDEIQTLQDDSNKSVFDRFAAKTGILSLISYTVFNLSLHDIYHYISTQENVSLSISARCSKKTNKVIMNSI